MELLCLQEAKETEKQNIKILDLNKSTVLFCRKDDLESALKTEC